MTVVRKNILNDDTARADFIEGVLRLKEQDSGRTTGEMGIPGIDQPVYTYDLFVHFHIWAANRGVPGDEDPLVRNLAHRSPTFLPWHRRLMLDLEESIRRVLGKDSFALPYWAWQADADSGQPEDSMIWEEDYMGGQGDPITTGSFRIDSDRPYVLRIVTDGDGMPISVRQGLSREFGGPRAPTLPDSADVKRVIEGSGSLYDMLNFSRGSDGFRNRLEGFRPADGDSHMHNRVHAWVGGDMVPMSSPNDPVFFLHHCNVDRIWEGWMRRNGRLYAPDQNAMPDRYEGIRVDDPLPALIGDPRPPGFLLDVTRYYTYDELP